MGLAPEFLVCIGSSTGGPSAVREVLTQLPEKYAGAVIVAQHLGDEFTEALAEWLQSSTSLRCQVARDGQEIEQGCLYLAPGGGHLVLSSVGRFAIVPAARGDIHAPGIDQLFQSVANNWQGKGIGILLSGMGRDGAAGLLALKKAHFTTITQTESSCVVYGMPRAAFLLGASEHVLAPGEIGTMIASFSAADSSKPSRPRPARGIDREFLQSLAAKSKSRRHTRG